MKIRISAITDKGKEREINQDAFTLCPDLSKPDWTIGCMEKYMPLGNYGTLVVVADGMGGANAGEVELTEGDVIGLFYIDDGLSITIDLGGGGAPIVWSIHRIA